jgi:serine/threonine-protein kinase HipA
MELFVYLFDELAGILRTTDNRGLTFSYAKEYIEKMGSALSLSLPLQEKEFSQKECLPYFIGLLPEGEVKKRIAQALHISELSTIKFLEALGGECAGSVSFYTSSQQEEMKQEINLKKDVSNEHPTKDKYFTRSWFLTNENYTELSEKEIFKLVQNIHMRPLIQGAKELRLSLAGAQEKLSLARIDEKWHLPKYGAPSTHILKPSIKGSFDYIAENEYFCTQYAKTLGLQVPDHDLVKIDDTYIFIIERHDRFYFPEDQKIERLHQEDFCQALGIMSDSKYQNDGGPSIADCTQLIKDKFSNPISDVSAFFKAVVFNYMIGNCDAHGKNFSLLKENSFINLAPLYDLVSTSLYPSISSKMAMKIGNKYDITQITKSDFIKLAELCDIKPRVFFDILEKYATSLNTTFNSIIQNPILYHCKDFLLPLREQMQTRIEQALK